ncbi:MAG: efflux RND transporter permease subunit [Planctomycetota bacterium]|jgi:multidrug efflux pump subunit AcrB
MHTVIDWFARNSVAANLLMIIIIVGGLLSVWGVKKEIFPEMEMEIVTVAVLYPGTEPETVESQICIKVEEQIYDIQGIKKVTSVASENIGSLIIEFERGYDVQEKLDEVKMRIDAIDFPDGAEPPIVQQLDISIQVINLAVMGDVDEMILKKVAENVRDEISELPGITQVTISGVREYEISVEVSEWNLRRHGLTFDHVVGALRRSSLDLPGGSIKTSEGEILIRSKAQKYTAREFGRIPIIARPDGTYLTLGQIAEVSDGFVEDEVISGINGEGGAVIMVYRVGEQSAITVSKTVKEYAERKQKQLPNGVKLVPFLDMTEFLKSRLDLLQRNGILGFIFVFIILTIFIRLRLAFWVSLGIPISFLGAMWLMPGFDISINMISLFAFILVLGIVVDDAIIVGENIHTVQEKTGRLLEGSIKGAQEVSIPVIFAVLTTMAAFLPLLSFSGPIGKFIYVVPIIVIFTLAFSLVESLLILPAHLSIDPGKRRKGLTNLWGLTDRFAGIFMKAFWWVVRVVYSKLLEAAIRRRYLTVAIFVAVLILSIGLIAGDVVSFVFFPDIESDYIAANLTMPEGTPFQITVKGMDRIEKAVIRLNEEYKAEYGKDLIVFRQVLIGARADMDAHTGMTTEKATNIGMVMVQLLKSEERALSSQEIGDRWRELTGVIPDVYELEFRTSMRSTGKAIEFQLSGPDIGELREVAAEMKARLTEYEGVYDIGDTFVEGKEEISHSVLPEAQMLLGLSNLDLARQVRQAYYGEEVQKVQRGRDDIPVMVKYPMEERLSLGSLDELRIRTPSGVEAPFWMVARPERGRGYSAIRRIDRKRALNVYADVDTAVNTANTVVKEFVEKHIPGILEKHPRVSWDYAGEQSEQREALAEIWKGVIIALIAIYALMAVPFKSYLQPAIVMSAIPFGMIGAVLGHLIMGYQLSMISMFGLVALAGVVVNDSLVLVDFINRKRKAGIPLDEAIRDAGVVRFRPILLTSLTTFFGLMPMIFETSFQARILIPMAISLAFGVMLCTFITLILIPVEYRILEDLKAAGRKVLAFFMPAR